MRRKLRVLEMERWKIEGWKDGKIEGWKNGNIERWKIKF